MRHTRTLTAGLAAASLLVAAPASAAAVDAPDVTVDGTGLAWAAVPGAEGYNVYRGGTSSEHYLTTVRGATTFDADSAGTYYVTAFDEDTSPTSYSAFSEPVTVGGATPGPDEPGDDWRTVFEDTFDENSIGTDWTIRDWARGTRSNRAGTFGTTEACAITGGQLVLEAELGGLGGDDLADTCFLQGANRPELKFGPGDDSTLRITFEADVSEVDAAGFWFASWLHADWDEASAYDGDLSTGTEIDVLEYIPYEQEDGYDTLQWFNAAVHSDTSFLPGDGDGELISESEERVQPESAGVDISEGMHTWTLEWNRDCQVFAVDGVPYWNNDTEVSSAPVHSLMLTIEGQDGTGAEGRNIWGYPVGDVVENLETSQVRAVVEEVRVESRPSGDDDPLCATDAPGTRAKG